MTVIVDYGLGNLQSIAKMIEKAGGQAKISSQHSEIAAASSLILPGVGAFDNGMRNLRSLDLIETLERRVLRDGIPILGICLGLQLMTRQSDEGGEIGLGWFEAETRKFDVEGLSGNIKVPNMGWRLVKPQSAGGLFAGFDSIPKFYFVHSFHCFSDDQSQVLATSHHGYEFCCGLQRRNVMGVQFHPEKSHRFGCRLIENFLQISSSARVAA